MSDLESMQACIGKIKSIEGMANSIWDELEEATISVHDMIMRIKTLTDRYNETRNWIANNFFQIGMQMPSISFPSYLSDKDEAVSILQNILIGCQTAEKGLEAMLKPSVEPKVVDKLDSIRNDLEDFKEKGLDLNLIKNIQTAIEEAEQGHYLASAMISSRAITYISDQIKGKTDEEKVQYLIDKGIIQKDRKDEQKQLMSSMRLSRNFLSHRIDIFSDSGNVLMLLGGAVALSRFLLSLIRN